MPKVDSKEDVTATTGSRILGWNFTFLTICLAHIGELINKRQDEQWLRIQEWDRAGCESQLQSLLTEALKSYWGWGWIKSEIGSNICAVLCLVAQSCPTLCNPMDCKPSRLLCPWNFPGKTTGVGYHALFQGIFPTQESNPGFPHCRWLLYQLSDLGSPLTYTHYYT